MYVIIILIKLFKIVKNNTNVPCARAAHAACSNENLEMFIYGGSILGNLTYLNNTHIQ